MKIIGNFFGVVHASRTWVHACGAYHRPKKSGIVFIGIIPTFTIVTELEGGCRLWRGDLGPSRNQTYIYRRMVVYINPLLPIPYNHTYMKPMHARIYTTIRRYIYVWFRLGPKSPPQTRNPHQTNRQTIYGLTGGPPPVTVPPCLPSFWPLTRARLMSGL
jgi:hypothetical protein